MSSTHLQIIYRLFKAAMESPQTVKLSSSREALSFRQSLYNAVRGLKKTGCPDDFELERAVHEVEIVKGERVGDLILRRRTESAGIQAIMNTLGMTKEQAENIDMPDLSELEYLEEKQPE